MDNRAVKVLVVDDDDIRRGLLRMSLQRLGYWVEGAEGGEVALQKLQTGHYELILFDTDTSMAIPNGLTVLEKMRATVETPIIIITPLHWPASDMLEKAFQLGADNYLTKPFNHQDVATVVHATLRRN